MARRPEPERSRPARARLSPHAGAATVGEWVLGRRPAPFVVEKPAPHRPDLLLLLDPDADRVLAVQPVQPGTGTPAFVKWAAGKLRSATHLRVEEEALAQALRERLGDAVAIRVAPAPELDGMVDFLDDYAGRIGDRREREPPWTDDALTDALTGFYVAAARFERSEPWKTASDSHVLAVDVPALGRKAGIVSLMGMGGESFGLLLLRSLDDYVAFLRLAAGDAGAHRRAPGAGVSLFSIGFERPRDLPGGKKLAARARSHGFTPGPEGRVPFILNVSADAVRTPPTTDDYRLATAVLEAVRRFVEKHGKLFTAPPRRRIEEGSTVVMPAGDVDVVVTAPPPDLPWRWGEEDAIDGMHGREMEEILAPFHAARRASGASEEEADADVWAAEELLQFKTNFGRAVDEWTPDDITKYLLEYYPAHGRKVGEDLQAIPGRIDGFLGWLSSSGRGPAAALAAAQKRLAEGREAFLREASDPRRFGLAKAVLLAMQQAGVDESDEAAVEAFMQDFDRRLKDDPSLLADLPGRRRPKAWVWSGEGPPPDPHGPCPCGSDKRYRKCCQPR